KQRKFALRLRARGFSDADIARVHSPLGVAIGAETPEEIAVSVMGTLIAVRRGATIEAPWAPPEGVGRKMEESTEAAASDAEAAGDPVDAALTRLLDGLAGGEAARDEEITP